MAMNVATSCACTFTISWYLWIGADFGKDWRSHCFILPSLIWNTLCFQYTELHGVSQIMIPFGFKTLYIWDLCLFTDYKLFKYIYGFWNVYTYPRDIADSVPNNCNKATIAIKWVTWFFFGFLVHVKVMITLYCQVCNSICLKIHIP